MKRLLIIALLLCPPPSWAQWQWTLVRKPQGSAGVTAPTLVSGTPVSTASYTTGGASKTITVPTVSSGDYTVVQCVSESDPGFNTPTWSKGTFSMTQLSGTGTNAGAMISTVTATSAGSNIVITVGYTGSTGDHWGCTATSWQHSGGFAGVWAGAATGTQNNPWIHALVTSSVHSGIVWSCADYSAGGITSINATPTPTASPAKADDGTRYSYFVQYLTDQAAAGSVNVGVTGSTTVGPYACAHIEVIGL